MNKCVGILGKVFGHKFEQLFTIKDSTSLTMSFFESSHWAKVFAKKNIPIVATQLMCKRCGQQKEVNNEIN